MLYCFPHLNTVQVQVFKVASPSPSLLNFSLMPSKVKAKPAGLPAMAIVPLFIKQEKDKNIHTATFPSLSRY